MGTDRDSRLGLFSCIALTVGACIGSAIFSISGVTVEMAGPAAVLSWIVAAVISGLYGIVVIRLAGRYPDSGGIFVFPRRVFGGGAGRAAGFFSGWGYVVSNTIAIAFSAIYIGIYSHPVFTFIAMGLAIVLVRGRIRRSQAIQNVLVVALVSILLVYIGGSLLGEEFSESYFSGFFSSGSLGRTGFLSAVPLAMVAYGGSVVIAFMASDVRRKNFISFSFAVGLGTVSLIYAAVLVAMVGTGAESLTSDIPFIKVITDAGAIVALFTTIVALLRVNISAIQAISDDGLLPSGSTGIMVLLALILCFFSKYTLMLISLGAVLNIVSMTVTSASLVRAETRCGRILPVAVMVVLWICYIPGIVRGDVSMWIFTLIIYALGAVVLCISLRKGHRCISGVVVHGKGHGSLHDMPTANLKPYPGEMPPPQGVWGTKVRIGGKEFRGLTSVGRRPSDDNSEEISVETWILDGFCEEIYGKKMSLEFVQYIRPVRKFPGGLNELRLQIEKDKDSLHIFVPKMKKK